MSSWTLTYDKRPDFTLNKERTVHHMVRAKIVKEWREKFCELAEDAMIPRLEKVEVVAQPYVITGKYRQDTGAMFGLAKAAIDGLVDAGVLIDDNSKVVVKLTFLAPLYGKDALELTVIEAAGVTSAA